LHGAIVGVYLVQTSCGLLVQEGALRRIRPSRDSFGSNIEHRLGLGSRKTQADKMTGRSPLRWSLAMKSIHILLLATIALIVPSVSHAQVAASIILGISVARCARSPQVGAPDFKSWGSLFLTTRMSGASHGHFLRDHQCRRLSLGLHLAGPKPADTSWLGGAFTLSPGPILALGRDYQQRWRDSVGGK
jgi:hypothetical protein